MTRQQLQEAIKIIVKRKLNEFSAGNYKIGGDNPESPRRPKPAKEPKFGYIVGQVTKDPTVQIMGYGTMRLSQLKKLALNRYKKTNNLHLTKSGISVYYEKTN